MSENLESVRLNSDELEDAIRTTVTAMAHKHVNINTDKVVGDDDGSIVLNLAVESEKVALSLDGLTHFLNLLLSEHGIKIGIGGEV